MGRVALEEELQLDLGPALDAIRGDLTRALEDVPATFRTAFDDQLQGVVADFGAAAELAREELDRVFAVPVEVAPVEVPVDVDSTELDGLSSAIAGAGGPVDVPVEVDDTQIQEATEAVEALDGQTVTVTAEVDAEGLSSAADSTEELSTAAEQATVNVGNLSNNVATLVSGIADVGKFSSGGGVFAVLATAAGVFAHEAINADSATRSFEARVGDLAETLNRVDVAGLNEDLADFALRIGADDDGLRLALANFTALGVASGRSRIEIGALGQDLTVLAGYFSVLNPELGNAEDIADRLPAAFARGGRALTEYGISLTRAQIEQRALTDSGKATVEELTQFDRAAAGLALTMENLGDRIAAGIDKGVESPAVKLRILRTRLGETFEGVGAELVDPLIDALTALTPVLEDLAQGAGKTAAGFADVLVPVLEAITPLVDDLAGLLEDVPGPLLAAGVAALLFAKNLKEMAVADAEAAVAAEAAAVARIAANAQLTVAQAAAVAATEARLAAEAELVAANVSLSVSDGVLIGLQVDVATAEAGVVVATAAEAAAMEALAVAEAQATAASAALVTALAPLAIAAAAVAIVYLALTTDIEKFSVAVSKGEKLTNAQLVETFKTVQALGKAREFSNAIAAESIELAIRLRDSLAAEGVDTRELSEAIDEAAAHNRQLAKDKAAVSEETLKNIAALEDEDPATRLAAANTLKLSLAYQDLDPAVRKSVDSIIAQAKATQDASAAAAELKKRTDDTAVAANEAADAFDAATSALAAYLGLAVDTQGQGLKFAIVLDDLKKKQDDFTKEKGKTVATYALETAEGRKNIDMLIGIVDQQSKIAVQNIARDQSEEGIAKATALYREQVNSLRAVATQTGLTAKQFDDLLAFYGLTPKQLDTAIVITKVDEAKASVDSFRSDVEKVPIELSITTNLDAAKAYRNISRTLASLGPFSVPLTDLTFLNPDQLGYNPLGNSEGSVLESYAEGGVRRAERYANGEDHTAFIGSGVTRVFNEPETGGEAYIPLSPAKRDRSTDILEDVAGRFGYDLIPAGARRFADGQVIDAGSGQGWSDAGMLRALAAVVDAVQSLPEKLPRGGDTYNFDATAEQRDALREIAESIVAASRRR